MTRPGGWPAGTGRLVLDEVDSTNAEAARRAAAGEPGPLWIMGRRQRAGRGRQGRGWASPEGNLAATLLLRPKMPPAEAALHSFAAALAVADLCAGLLPRAEIALKWPNDVLIGGRKVAGILLESSGARGRLDWLAIGIGVNLASAPETVRPGGTPATSLVAEGAPALDPEDALDALAPPMALWTRRLAEEGFASLRRAWLARAAHLGRRIFVALPEGRIEGRFDDVDESGALVLHTPSGPRRIAAAEIHLPG
jgi:BirA family biotin operon repressor/biotin-[acetyl-CoA-carboxylase] ligase